MKVTSSGYIEIKNQSAIMEFTLIGLTDNPKLQVLLFGVFTLIYVISLTGNILLIFIICTSSKLHTPMYFLLINLSLVNIMGISATIPKLLHTLLSKRKSISFWGCMAQMFFFVWTVGSECLLLTIMAFDRYAAICQPLQYTVIMRKEVCLATAAGVWIGGMANAAAHTSYMLQLSFCNSRVLNHFYCDLLPLLQLSCSDTTLNETMIFVSSVVFAVGSCGLTFTSYFFILKSIFKIRSIEGKKKAFSTCSSHLIVVSLYFSTIIYTYIRPSSTYSLDKDKIISVLYLVATPALNPLIYSLRNRDVKEVLKILTKRARV